MSARPLWRDEAPPRIRGWATTGASRTQRSSARSARLAGDVATAAGGLARRQPTPSGRLRHRAVPATAARGWVAERRATPRRPPRATGARSSCRTRRVRRPRRVRARRARLERARGRRSARGGGAAAAGACRRPRRPRPWVAAHARVQLARRRGGRRHGHGRRLYREVLEWSRRSGRTRRARASSSRSPAARRRPQSAASPSSARHRAHLSWQQRGRAWQSAGSGAREPSCRQRTGTGGEMSPDEKHTR